MLCAIVLGTKAEFIKMSPVMLELKNRNIEYLFIHTGQHDLGDLPGKFGVKGPDKVINPQDGFKGDTGGAVGWAVKTVLPLTKVLKNSDVKIVLVHGDTMSTLIGCVACRLARVRVAHVEAGLRSGNLREPFPEEIVRRIVDFLSDTKFAPSEKCASRLRGNVFNVGNTGTDALFIAQNLCKSWFDEQKPYAVCTVHRHENIKSKDRMKKIINILAYCQMPVLFFVHKNTEVKLKEYGLWKKVLENKNIKPLHPIPYIEFSKLMGGAHIVFTDGGGMSEEAAALNIPCVILRMATEREELLDRGDQVLTKLDEDTAKLAIMKFSLPRDVYMIENVYDCGGASKKIIDILLNITGQ